MDRREDRYGRGRGHEQRGDRSRSPRRDGRERHTEEYREERGGRATVEKMVRLGDRDQGAPSHVARALDDLCHEVLLEFPHNSAPMYDTLFRCVISVATIPIKTPLYGTLAGLLNAADSEIGKDIAARAIEELQAALNNEQWAKAKLLVRFITELTNANVVSASALVRLFDQLLAAASETDAPPARTAAYVMLVIAALPFGGRELSALRPDDVQRLLRSIGTIMSGRKWKPHPLLTALDDAPLVDPVEDAWGRVRDMHADDWAISCIFQAYTSFSARLNVAMQHQLTPLDIPAHTASSRYITYPVATRIFSRTELEANMKPVERFVIADQIADTLFFFHASYKECVKQLFNIPASYTYEHLLVETIFSEIFRLPRMHYRLAYYTAVCVNLCRVQPSVPPVLAQAMDVLFNKLGKMDVECIDRYTEWFSHFLSNFDYKWTWANWVEALKLEPESNKMIFVREAVQKFIRLSYHDRIKQAIPEELWTVLPKPIQPVFKYRKADAAHADVAAAVMEKLRQRTPADQLQQFLQQSSLDEDTQREVLLQCILHVGEKSLSHVMNVLERNIPVLKAYSSSPGAKQRIIHIVADFWQASQQMQVILVDKLMTYQVVDSTAIITWLFAEEMVPHFSSHYVWEVLDNVITKTIARTETVRADLARAEDALQRKMDSHMGDDGITIARIPLWLTWQVDVSTEKQLVENIRAMLEHVTREQKELFLVVFQRFTMVLAEYLEKGSKTGTNVTWFQYTIGHFKSIGRKYLSEIAPFLRTLETLLFTSGMDERITSAFQLFKTL